MTSHRSGVLEVVIVKYAPIISYRSSNYIRIKSISEPIGLVVTISLEVLFEILADPSLPTSKIQYSSFPNSQFHC